MEHEKMKQEDNSTYTFVVNLRDKLLERTYLSENYDIRIDNENNGNAKASIAIVAKHKKGEMEFTIYIGAPDDDCVDGMPSEKSVMEVEKLIIANAVPDCFDSDIFVDYEKAKDRIIPILINRERNQEELKLMPHYSYGEFALGFAIRIPEIGQTGSISKIYDNQMESLGVTIEDLWHLAYRNVEVFDRTIINSIETYSIKEIREKMSYEDRCNETDDILDKGIQDRRFYVLANRVPSYAAAGIFQEKLLHQLSEKTESDLVLIFSSVHEVLIIKYEEGMKFDDIESFIKETNKSMVSSKEFMSDHVYIYDRMKAGIRSADNEDVLTLTAMKNIPLYNIQCK